MMSEELFQATRESIRENGFVDPVTVRSVPGELGAWEILDGEHRWRAAIAEGMTEIAINDLGDVGDASAQRLTVIFMQHGEADEVLLGRLVRGVYEAFQDEGRIPGLAYDATELDALIKIGGAHLPELDAVRPDALLRVTLSFRVTPAEQERVEVALEVAMRERATKGPNDRAAALAEIVEFYLMSQTAPVPA